MAATIIDGRALAARLREQTAERVRSLSQAGTQVRLDAVLVQSSDDAAAHVYAQNQARMCAEIGIDYELHELPNGSTERELCRTIDRLNQDDRASAIMVHMPIPIGIDTYTVQSAIAPAKDVEGVNPANIGNIVYGRSSIAPCTALAVLKMIESTGIDLRGKFAVCVGASDIVGKPVAVLLMQRQATVVSCTKYTRDITELTRKADILVTATGVPGLIRNDWVRNGAVVIDVGISRVPGADGKMRTVGDVKVAEVSEVASWVSPVPGGVGPVTVAVLLENVVAAAERMTGVYSSGNTKD